MSGVIRRVQEQEQAASMYQKMGSGFFHPVRTRPILSKTLLSSLEPSPAQGRRDTFHTTRQLQQFNIHCRVHSLNRCISTQQICFITGKPGNILREVCHRMR
jgi:hypothetical protein